MTEYFSKEQRQREKRKEDHDSFSLQNENGNLCISSTKISDTNSISSKIR